MISTDKMLTCSDCGTEFVFSTGEQEFFAQKGFTNSPGRCPDCRAARKTAKGAAGYSNQGFNARTESDRPRRELFKATCSGCGGVAEVPFNPSADRPVYCRDCFSRR